jgi:hypothetical protein
MAVLPKVRFLTKIRNQQAAFRPTLFNSSPGFATRLTGLPLTMAHNDSQNSHKRSAAVKVWLACVVMVHVCLSIPAAIGDEIVLDGSRPQVFSLGDFSVSTAAFTGGFDLNPISSISGAVILNNADIGSSGCEMRAGDLWKYLKSQGIHSTDRLTFYVDLQSDNSGGDVSLDDFEFTISGPDSAMALTHYEMNRNGGNRIVVPGFETSLGGPEAAVEVYLGYDFMERFSESSTELVVLNSKSSGAISQKPEILVQGRPQQFGILNTVMLTGFVGFWLIVFWVLKRVTLPQRPTTDQANREAATHQAA